MLIRLEEEIFAEKSGLKLLASTQIESHVFIISHK